MRELRQHASELLRRVSAGERIEVTRHGRVVAVLSPPGEGEGVVARLEREGRLKPASYTGPVPPPRPAARSASAALEEMRADER